MTHPPAHEPVPTAALRPSCDARPPRRRRAPKPIVIIPKPRYRRSERGERVLTVAQMFDGNPMIRMRGDWLGRLGFTCDARFVVSEEQGRLVLTLTPEE